MTNIFVGNLSYATTESELEAAFGEHGAVEKVSVVRDRDTGQSRGFAFVEMTNSAEANNAINALNGREINGRALNVNEARPREARSPGGGGGFGGGGGGGRPSGGGGGRGGNGGAGGGRGPRREPRW
jgi:cold-inducible RNA-binding protein